MYDQTGGQGAGGTPGARPMEAISIEVIRKAEVVPRFPEIKLYNGDQANSSKWRPDILVGG